MSQVNQPTCPTNCTFNVPRVLFTDCNPITYLGQIKNLYIAASTATDLSDWTSPVEWAARINNTDNGADLIRRLHVIGSKPVPDKQSKVIDHGITLYGKKKFKLPFKIYQLHDLNYQFMLQLECGGTFKMWYETDSGLLYGGNAGIDVSITLDEDIPESTDDFITLTGQAEWQNKFHPDRVESPIA